MMDEESGEKKLSIGNIDFRLEKIDAKIDLLYERFCRNAHDVTGVDSESDISLFEIFNVVWMRKWIVAAIFMVSAFLSVTYALYQPNIYRAEALLAPSQEAAGDISAIGAKFGGLASLAGISIPGGGDKVVVAMEVIKSRQFAANLINKYDLLVPLMATKAWNSVENKLIIDPELYDTEKKKWVRDVAPPKKSKPSDWEAYKEFSGMLSVSQDKKTSIVKVSIEHLSPTVAKNWVDLVVHELNDYIRSNDIKEAKDSISYLEKQLEQTSIAGMRSIFYQLVEEQSKKIMLANVREGYVFSTVDKAVVPEMKLKPRRSVMCVVGTMAGSVFGVFIILLHFFVTKRTKAS